MGFNGMLPAGNSCYSLLLNMAIEIVRVPVSMVIFHSYVELPEGNYDTMLYSSNTHKPSRQTNRYIDSRFNLSHRVIWMHRIFALFYLLGFWGHDTVGLML